MLEFFVRKRPFIDEFLEQMSRVYEVVFFSSASEEYTNKLLDRIDSNRVAVARLFKDSCELNPEGVYEKPIAKLGRSLKHTVLLDNTPEAFARNKENAIPVCGWFGDEKDEELMNLIPILNKLSQVKDVRLVI